MLDQAVFYFFAALAIVSAILVVTRRNAVQSAIFLVTALLATQRLQDGFALANFRFDPATKCVVHNVSNGNAAGATKMAATRFLVLREGGVYFEGGPEELADTKDEYLKRFLV